MTKEEFEKNCWSVSAEEYERIEALRKELIGMSDNEFYADYTTGLKDNSIVSELMARIDALKQTEDRKSKGLNHLCEKIDAATRALLREAHYQENENLKLVAIDLAGLKAVTRIDLEKNYRLIKQETEYILTHLI